jgi:hypothetical protein
MTALDSLFHDVSTLYLQKSMQIIYILLCLNLAKINDGNSRTNNYVDQTLKVFEAIVLPVSLFCFDINIFLYFLRLCTEG